MRRTRRPLRGHAPLWACVLAAACLLVALALPQAVAAHAAFVRSDPAADSAIPASPPRVTIWFSEPLAPALSGIEVFDQSRKKVDTADLAFDRNDPTVMSVGLAAGLPAGTYTVAWRNVSTVDGHSLRGSFVFYIGERPLDAQTPTSAPEPPTLPSPLDPWVRWFVTTSLLAAAGVLLFGAAVLRPALGLPTREPARRATAEVRCALDRLLSGSLAVLIVALLVHIVVQAAVAADTTLWGVRPSGIADAITETTWGNYWALRLTLVVLAALAVFALRTVATRPSTPELVARAGWALPFVLLVGALATISQSSHAAALGVLAIPATISDFTHLIAATLWVGGLFAFATTIVVLARNLEPAERRPLFAALASRFTIAAGLGLGALVITGLYASWLQVTSLPAIRTPYGYTLAAKVVLVAVIVAAGAANRLWVRPRLVRSEPGDPSTRWLRRLVTIEASLAVLVLLATAFLTSIEPARQVFARQDGGGIVFDQTDGSTRIRARVTPARPGSNTVRVEVFDRRGNPVTDASDVLVTARFVDAEIGESNANATLRENGNYETPTVVLSIAGAWQVQVRVARQGLPDATAATRFYLSAAATGTAGPPEETGRALWAWAVVALGMLFLVVAPRAWRTRIARSRVRILSTAVLLSGVVLIYGVHTHGGPQLAGVNPITPDAASIEAGRELFAAHCAQCHGELGLGDGPAAAALNPPPANLSVHVPLHGDGQLFAFVSGGLPGTAMPAFAGQLTDTQIWHLVNYLRTLAVTPTTK